MRGVFLCVRVAYISRKLYFCTSKSWKNGQNRGNSCWKNGQGNRKKSKSHFSFSPKSALPEIFYTKTTALPEMFMYNNKPAIWNL